MTDEKHDCLTGLIKGAVQTDALIVDHESMARNTFRIRLMCPEVACQIVPGQFFMIRLRDRSDPLLARPFALYDIYCDSTGKPEGVDFGYVVVGKMTGLLQKLRVGDSVEIWGPLGNGFPIPDCDHLVIAAGGIGQTPFLAVVREALQRRAYGEPKRIVSRVPSKITLCYGVRSKEYLAGVKEFENEKIDVRISTDDGSEGHHGFVTDVLRDVLRDATSTHVYCCGPEPMMQGVSKLTLASDIPCWLSLETPMACGIGACFSCVTKVRQDDGTTDYRRICVEGPVIPADRIVFENASHA